MIGNNAMIGKEKAKRIHWCGWRTDKCNSARYNDFTVIDEYSDANTIRNKRINTIMSCWRQWINNDHN